MCARKVAPINEKSQLPAANIQKCPNLGHANPKESLFLLTKSILCDKLKFLRSINLNNEEKVAELVTIMDHARMESPFFNFGR